MFTSGWRVDGWVEPWMDRLSQPSKENRAERPKPSRRRDDGSELLVLTNVCDGRNLFGREARKCIKAQFSLGGESNQELAATLESFR